MDPRELNKINYNNYYVGQNLDFLIRNRMRAETLGTPLGNTPAFYDDQVNAKMSLLGKRGYYDPGYIYGFQNPPPEKINRPPAGKLTFPGDYKINMTNNNQLSEEEIYREYQRRLNQNKEQEMMSDIKEREKMERRNEEIERMKQLEGLRREEELMLNKQRERENYNHNLNNDNNNKDINEQYLTNHQMSQNYHHIQSGSEEKNSNFPNSISRDYYENEYEPDPYQSQFKSDYSYNRQNGELNLPKTREQIQHDVYNENFKRKQLAQQMLNEDLRKNYK